MAFVAESELLGAWTRLCTTGQGVLGIPLARGTFRAPSRPAAGTLSSERPNKASYCQGPQPAGSSPDHVGVQGSLSPEPGAGISLPSPIHPLWRRARIGDNREACPLSFWRKVSRAVEHNLTSQLDGGTRVGGAGEPAPLTRCGHSEGASSACGCVQLPKRGTAGVWARASTGPAWP